MNVRLRLTLWYTAIFSLILIMFSVAVYVGLTRNLLNAVDRHLQREVGEILGNLEFEHEEDEHEGERRVEVSYTPEEGVYWRVLDANGRPIIDVGHFDGASYNADVANLSQSQLENITLADGTPLRLFSTPFVIEHQGAGVVQVAESYRHLQEVQNQLLLLLVVGIPFTLLASSAGGWFLASSALDPIDRITRTARRISARDLHQRLDMSLPNDEVGRLAATFDEMLDRLEESFEQQKRFIADASHELKTPLTVLKGDVDVALARPRSPEYYQDTLERVNSTTDRLTALVQELLLLSRVDSNRMLLKPEIFNLTNLLTREVAALMPNAVDKQIALHLDTPDTLLIEADRAKLSRLFINLIENAIKYCRPNDSITVSAATQDEQICVTIADTGPGIHQQHLPHLFERFYRVDEARSRAIADDTATGGRDTDDIAGSSSGAGLGLSIVQWLAQAHHGRVEVDSRLEHGTTFTVWLPRKQGINGEL